MDTASDKVRFRLTLDVTYDRNDVDAQELEAMLAYLPGHYAGHGGFTGDTPATVDKYTSTVEELPVLPDPLPKTHVLVEGQPVCGFMRGHVPADWPDGHVWCRLDQMEEVVPDRQCSDCFSMAATQHGQPLGEEDKVGGVIGELFNTIENELNNQSEWSFDGDQVALALSQGHQLLVKMQSGDTYLISSVRYKEGGPASENPSYCDDGGCPGWGIFHRDGEGVNDIQRCDNCQRFDSDDEALAHVRVLEGMDIARQLIASEEPLHNWLKSHIQFPRLLAELYAHMEVSEDTETMTPNGYFSVKIVDLCESMSLDWPSILELFQRAEIIWEHEKALTVKGIHHE